MCVLGMISGTSHDGIDIAVVSFELAGTRLTGRIEHTATAPYRPELRRRLLAALPPAPVGFDVACELDTRLGQAFAAAAAEALEAHRALAGLGPVDAICSHGQTVFHWVEGDRARGTLQLGQPAWIAEATGLPVVSDLRAADLAAGGHGAPLVPILDRLLLAPLTGKGLRAGALNIGGIANVTVCAADEEPFAFDIGPGNALIDAVVTASADTPDTFDRDGALAREGRVDPALLAELLAEPYYSLPAPKSSGKELFHLDYVNSAVRRVAAQLCLADLVATLTELTAVTIADAIRAAGIDTLVASGGGVRNPVLMSRLAELAPDVKLMLSDELGVPTDDKEAVAFALIGWGTLHGLPGNVPSCTGAAGPRVLGRVTPAPRAALPEARPLPAWPQHLTLASNGPDRSR
jgi:anhydro-N-acetylmuramic acid kinase